METKFKFLYIAGVESLDKLIEKKYQGEDVYVEIIFYPDQLSFSFNEYNETIPISSISKIQLLAEDGFIVITFQNNDCIFNYDFFITFELLDLIYKTGHDKFLPDALKLRYIQMQDRELFRMISKERESMPDYEYFHYFDGIDELQYKFISESFAFQALIEAPLLYIKYLDSGDRELGMLITCKSIYCPENSIEISEIQNFRIVGTSSSITCYINDCTFTDIYLPVRSDYRHNNHLFSSYQEFPAKKIELLIKKICNHINQQRDKNYKPLDLTNQDD
ncbi:MAG: hypothetical protein A2W91_01395 [Bacteroidetes bacterium GWF2_38_335]|nr:MAG: hypothetical protein A2W91_01395 [Bacteroidetes bacterium GWF2_38_335]OFY80947.1 MAG: hypothetical protein A2281_12870 [Bacteroidetes bacterium RIFOXYA12_FULL_38_20]HBS85118.1 hypothetical protein [Bacteroidales bacterium]